jgi:hypothetical protein
VVIDGVRLNFAIFNPVKTPTRKWGIYYYNVASNSISTP